jgi:GT2 family glycosyltransferase
MRRFPSVARAVGEALGSERWPTVTGQFGERILGSGQYFAEHSCDWISGSFLALRREALDEVGLLDERFFLYAEELDLCLRIKEAGWDVRHLPVMTIVHHANRAYLNPQLSAQSAYARLQFADKHFSSPSRLAFRMALVGGLALRGIVPVGGSSAEARRKAARASLRVLVGVDPPPFRAQSARG